MSARWMQSHVTRQRLAVKEFKSLRIDLVLPGQVVQPPLHISAALASTSNCESGTRRKIRNQVSMTCGVTLVKLLN